MATGSIKVENDSGWMDCTMQSGFDHWSSTYKLQYRKIGRICYIRGIAKNTEIMSASETHHIATVPVGFRPNTDVYGMFQGSGMNRFSGWVASSGVINMARYGTTTAIDVAVGSFLPMFFCYPIG